MASRPHRRAPPAWRDAHRGPAPPRRAGSPRWSARPAPDTPAGGSRRGAAAGCSGARSRWCSRVLRAGRRTAPPFPRASAGTVAPCTCAPARGRRAARRRGCRHALRAPRNRWLAGSGRRWSPPPACRAVTRAQWSRRAATPRRDGRPAPVRGSTGCRTARTTARGSGRPRRAGHRRVRATRRPGAHPTTRSARRSSAGSASCDRPAACRAAGPRGRSATRGA